MIRQRSRRIIEEKPYEDNYFVDCLFSQVETTKERLFEQNISVANLCGDELICPRKIWLARKFNLDHTRRVDANESIVWKMGRACEEKVRDKFISVHGRENVLGNWSCLCGKTTYEGYSYPEKDGQFLLCKKCGFRADHKYGEYDLIEEETRISGHPDLLFLHNKQLHVVEIKSMNLRDWQALEAPVLSHMKQASTYYRILKDKGVNVFPKFHILYVRKDFLFGKSPYKEFLVSYEDARWVADSVKASALSLAPAYGKEIPQRLQICTGSSSKIAQKCVACTYCFSTL